MEELEQELAVDGAKQIAKPSTAEAMSVCPELMVASGALPSCAGAGAVTMRSDGPRGSSSQHASFPAHARRARWGVAHGDLVGVKSEVEETAPSTSTPRKAAASPAAKFKQRIDGAETHPVMSPASAKSSVSRSSSVCPLTSPSSKHESGGGQSGLASAAAPRRHEDDDDDALDESLPVNKFSLAEKLPAGQACAPLTRIRATVNSYVDRVVSPAWLASFKLPTVKALQRRLLQHESSIIGNFHTDLEISYRQLVGRIGALIDLHKSLVACNESQKLGRISEVVGPMTVLNKYLEATEQHMAPDLSIIHMFALVQHDLKKNRPVADALSHVDVAQLARWQDELRQMPAENPEEEAEGSNDNEGHAKQEHTPISKRSRSALKATGGFRFLDVRADLVALLSTVVVDAVQTRMHKLPKTIVQDQGPLEEFINELVVVKACWAEMVGKLEAAKHVTDMMGSMVVVFQCVLNEEGRRPSASSVRCARRCIFAAAREQDHPGKEWAKAMSTYEGAKEAMTIAKEHAAGGLQDEAASNIYDAAVQRWEAGLGDIFDDLNLWLESGIRASLMICSPSQLSCREV